MVKKLVPWKTSLGILNLAATGVAQGKNMSATRQSGRESWRSRSSGSCSMAVAFKKLGSMSGEGISSTVSQPSTKPASTAGNLRVRTEIE